MHSVVLIFIISAASLHPFIPNYVLLKRGPMETVKRNFIDKIAMLIIRTILVLAETQRNLDYYQL